MMTRGWGKTMSARGEASRERGNAIRELGNESAELGNVPADSTARVLNRIWQRANDTVYPSDGERRVLAALGKGDLFVR